MSGWAEPYHLEVGDKGSTVRTLKRLLRTHPLVPCKLTNNDTYDSATQAAVMRLQKSTGCKNTSGATDWETWVMLGKMQLPIVLYHAAFNEPLLHDLLSRAQQQSGTSVASHEQLPPSVQDIYAGRVAYTNEMKRCDDRLAALFGEQGAYMAANGFDFTQQGFLNGRRLRECRSTEAITLLTAECSQVI